MRASVQTVSVLTAVYAWVRRPPLLLHGRLLERLLVTRCTAPGASNMGTRRRTLYMGKLLTLESCRHAHELACDDCKRGNLHSCSIAIAAYTAAESREKTPC